MKIVSWNVNGIRAIENKGFKEYLQNSHADIFCIQETKSFLEQISDHLLKIPGYEIFWHAGKRPGYAGTAIYSKIPVISFQNTFLGYEKLFSDGRMTQIEIENNIVLLNGYFPNGGTRADGTEMLSYKLSFYEELASYILSLQEKGKEIIVCGDFNICHTEIDIARPKENENSIGFLPIEREKLSWFLEKTKLTDAFRRKYPEKKEVYSWWSYRAGARARNIGWRLDYFAISENLFQKLENIQYETEVFGSDHCPVSCIFFD
jgi:exodeoxyribonuclease-3